MQMPNRKGWMSIIFISLILAVPFAITVYFSSPTYNKQIKKWRTRPKEGHVKNRSKVSSDRVLLLKNEKVTIERTCIIFKGIIDGKVNIDLYLLDLDPEIPYPLSFSKNAISQGVWLGNIMYSLLSAKDSVLKLKIQSSYHTR